MTDNLDDILSDLSQKINKDSPSFSVKSNNSYCFSVNPLYIYGGVPLIILFLFLLVRPGFVKKKDEKTGCEGLDLKKILIYTLVFTVIIDVGLYVYFNKKK